MRARAALDSPVPGNTVFAHGEEHEAAQAVDLPRWPHWPLRHEEVREEAPQANAEGVATLLDRHGCGRGAALARDICGSRSESLGPAASGPWLSLVVAESEGQVRVRAQAITQSLSGVAKLVSVLDERHPDEVVDRIILAIPLSGEHGGVEIFKER